ncbi:hypothetical protein RRG08_060011 [Elysia crispata]|uniref:Uncharacterized protein n=1 Tax=Elysia crispata TaxID=231223 RepID=A0AAE0YFM7_9GAST|nr:hypothetical protein RRG08_060011 [Elysia crispata]
MLQANQVCFTENQTIRNREETRYAKAGRVELWTDSHGAPDFLMLRFYLTPRPHPWLRPGVKRSSISNLGTEMLDYHGARLSDVAPSESTSGCP